MFHNLLYHLLSFYHYLFPRARTPQRLIIPQATWRLFVRPKCLVLLGNAFLPNAFVIVDVRKDVCVVVRDHAVACVSRDLDPYIRRIIIPRVRGNILSALNV